ncbi:MAG: hydroxyacylglutathione hydrolase [Nevskia sp.]
MITVTPIPAFSDNYLWLLERDGRAVVVDPGDGAVVLAALRAKGLQLVAILVTHHHPDHIGGLAALTAEFDVPVYGPRAEAAKIAGLSRLLDDGDAIEVLQARFEVLAVPGHTLGHIAYFQREQALLFCGDTLFVGGCGRLFEGTPAQMHASLSKLAALPARTAVYCAHEYTLGNLDFATTVEPGNAALAAEVQRVRALRAQGLPSVPSTIARETALNPFLRAAEPALAVAAAGHAQRPLDGPVEVFAELRRWKDGHRPR